MTICLLADLYINLGELYSYSSKDKELEYYQKIVCLFSLKRLEEAKVECELALDLAEKNYYDIVAIYVSILMELEEDDLAIKVLEEELEMPYIPYKYEVQFNASYDELLKRRMANNKVHSAFDLLSDDELKNALLATIDNNEFIILFSILDTCTCETPNSFAISSFNLLDIKLFFLDITNILL